MKPRLPNLGFAFLSVLFLFLLAFSNQAFAQCNALKPQITIDFNTDQPCAPVTVTKFDITFYFTVAQNPADIQIRYIWNDPANTVTTVGMGTGLTPGAGNTTFQANATFVYTTNNSCTVTPTAYIVIGGVVCPTSQQIQTAFFWGTEQEGNANMSINPNNYDVCFNNPVVNAILTDNSEFNCNPVVEPDQPNQLARHVQFVYGTNHNAAATIRNLTLTDGGPQGLTNGAGALVSSSTRGTAGLPVTAGYFGPIVPVPFPANGPNAATFPMNAPANVLNAVGNRFEITLFNWNFCNPWNGDTANPNYDDAVLTRAYIRIVDAPAPEFETRDNLGVPTMDFCIGETIFFANQTPSVGTYNYTWTFYDDATGIVTAGVKHSQNPTFSYSTGGQKLIRLSASNPTAQGSCIEEVTHLVNITPALIAAIQTTDLLNVPITPSFCQVASGTRTNFDVRFRDVSSGTFTAQTRWRWEFYDEHDVVVRQEPIGGGFSSTLLGPFDLQYANPGNYRVKLYIKDDVTTCETEDEVFVHVFENPVPVFTASPGCEGEPVTFLESSTLNAINGETIVLREWDFDYDGVTFNKDPAFDNNSNFTRLLGPGGTYQVALRVTANQNGCWDMLVLPVTINPLPIASFTPDITSGCSILTVEFTNNSVTGQPDVIDRFVWEADRHDGSGFTVLATQHPSDPGFSNIFNHDFENTSMADKSFDIRLRVVTVNTCERISPPATITVRPGTEAGFTSLNYSPFNDNCSPVSVNFGVDAATQALLPSDYTWKISDVGGVISEVSSGTIPTYSYEFINTSAMMKAFQVTLIATLPSGCFGDSTRTIRVSPVPSSAFDVDTIQFDCERMKIKITAAQKGLQYHWVIAENSVIMMNSTVADDVIEYEVLRSSTDISFAVSLDTRHLANCMSPVTTQSLVVPQKDLINAAFTVTPIVQTFPNATVTINNSTNSGPWTYLWDFDDGTTSIESGTTLQHTYDNFGTFTITLSVTSNVCTEVQSKSVIIMGIPPVIDFDYAPRAGCAPLTVKFTNLSRYADETTYVWEFGDGQSTSKAIDPSYTYFESGTYSVSLSATNSTGQTTKVTKEAIIDVYPLPSAQFETKPKEVTMPGGILYTSNRSIQAISYLWDFGDESTSTEVQPQHSYTAEGTYTITLIAYNQYGCTDTLQVNNGVKAVKGGQVLIPNAFSPNISGSTGSTPGAGKNDVFMPLMRGVEEFELLIFNRWGVLLFQTRDQQFGWDGYYNGKLCQQDVYVYKLTASFSDGEKIVRIGDVNLIR